MNVIASSLLPFCVKEFIVGFRSVYGILDLSEVRSKADLAAESALSFPLTLIWLWIQHVIISFLFDIESNLLNSLMIRGF